MQQNTMQEIRTAAAYARYSTDNQTENSIAYQLAAITKYCQDNNITITHTFIDEAQTGTNIDRAGFQQLLTAATAREFDTIVIYDISRGSRDVGDWFYFRKMMLSIGVNVISCQQQLGDPLNASDFLTELLSVGLGQHMVLETRKKSMDGVAAAAKTGKFLGGTAPLGYTIVNGKYVIVPSEAATVKLVFELYAAGYSYKKILKVLSSKGVLSRAGNPIQRNSLYYLLRNERYTGLYTWNSKVYRVMRKHVPVRDNPAIVKVEDAIPAIISKELFEVVQMKLKQNVKKPKSKAKETYLLSGLIKCEKCGASYHAYRSNNKRGNYYYYICKNRYKSYVCDAKSVRGDKLDAFVLDAVKQYLLGTDFEALAAEIVKRYNAASPDLSAEKKEVLEIDKKIQNGINAILSGFDSPELRSNIDSLKTRKEELKDVIAAGSSHREIDAAKLAAKLRNNVIDLESADAETLHNLVAKHVAYISANVDGSYTVYVGYSLAAGSAPIIGAKKDSSINKAVFGTVNSGNAHRVVPKTKQDYFIVAEYTMAAA